MDMKKFNQMVVRKFGNISVLYWAKFAGGMEEEGAHEVSAAWWLVVENGELL